MQNSGIHTSTSAGPGRPRSLRRIRRRRTARAQPPLARHRRRVLRRSLTRLRRLIQTPGKTRVLPCSTSFVPLRRAAPGSWTAAPARGPSASSTRCSSSWRARCYADASSNTASRCACPQRRPPCCRPRSPLRLRRLYCPRPGEKAEVFPRSLVRRGTVPVSLPLSPCRSDWRSRAQPRLYLSFQQ